MEDEVNNVPLKTALPCHLTPKQQAGLTRLLGRRRIVRCNIQGRETEALWDTGSQVCVISRAWKQANLPFKKLRSVDELLQEGKELSLEAINGTDIPFDGWIEVTLRLVGDDADADEHLVPVLVGQQEHDYPIIGFSVIEEILKRHNEEPLVVSHTMIRRSFPSVHPSKVGMLVNLIRTRTEDACTSVVRVGRRDVMVPRGKSLKCMCRVHLGPVTEELPIIFEPKEESDLPEGLELSEELSRIIPGTSSQVTILVHNSTIRNILLKRRTELGQIYMVKSVLPLPKLQDQEGGQEEESAEVPPSMEQTEELWQPPIDLSHLEEDEQSVVRETLREEAGAFARDENEVGCIDNLELNINLTDDKPVQKTMCPSLNPSMERLKST